VEAQELIRLKIARLNAALDATSRDRAYVVGLGTAQVAILADAVRRAAAIYENEGLAGDLRDTAADLVAACVILVEALS
jgi:hypothetical protein